LVEQFAVVALAGHGASVVAATCLVVLAVNSQRAAQSPNTQSEAVSYMVATLARDYGVASWTATMDLQLSQMVIVPASPEAMASAHSPQLWLITPGQPISVGVIVADKPTTLHLSPTLLAKLSAQALLAVSVEPHGGSPTGLPTGPVIAKGNISGA
jgi:anti-sigma-K factor RskA